MKEPKYIIATPAGERTLEEKLQELMSRDNRATRDTAKAMLALVEEVVPGHVYVVARADDPSTFGIFDELPATCWCHKYAVLGDRTCRHCGTYRGSASGIRNCRFAPSHDFSLYYDPSFYEWVLLATNDPDAWEGGRP